MSRLNGATLDNASSEIVLPHADAAPSGSFMARMTRLMAAASADARRLEQRLDTIEAAAGEEAEAADEELRDSAGAEGGSEPPALEE
jgi:hypothetical protein